MGRYEAELEREGIKFESFVRQLQPVDRCLCDGVDMGFVKLTVLEGSDQIIGATICAEHAGWCYETNFTKYRAPAFTIFLYVR